MVLLSLLAHSILLLTMTIVLVKVRTDLNRIETLSRMTFWALADDLEERGRITNLNKASEP